ncbi:MAG: AAA family ATPase [bacterium]|nr:AAA family ATPase [bacterium]
MLVKSLKLKNFGSFRDVFIEFPLKGVFLISGKTGSGKSTILEAISFALFKRTPKYGFDDSLPLKELPFKLSIDKNKLSHSLIELEFFINNDLYKIRREWKYDFKNNRVKEHVAEIYKNNEPLKVKVKDVEYEIIRILGFDDIKKAYNNFIKVVFLPQNQFDNFLLSTPKERESILLDLFNLNLYYEIKEKVSKEFNNLKNQIENYINNIDFIKKKIIQNVNHFYDNFKNINDNFYKIKSGDLKSLEIIFNSFNDFTNLFNNESVDIMNDSDKLNIFYSNLVKFKDNLERVLNKFNQELDLNTKELTLLKELRNFVNQIFISFNVDNILSEVEQILVNFDKENFLEFLNFEEDYLKNYLQLLLNNRDLFNRIISKIEAFKLGFNKSLNDINDYFDKIYKIYLNYERELGDIDFKEFVFSVSKFISLKEEFENTHKINFIDILNKVLNYLNKLELEVDEFIKKYQEFSNLFNNFNDIKKNIKEINYKIEITKKEYNELLENLEKLKKSKEYLEKYMELTDYVNSLRKYILENNIDKCLVCKNKINDFSLLESINLSDKEKEKIYLEKEIKVKEKQLEKINVNLSKFQGIYDAKLQELNLITKKIDNLYKDINTLITNFIKNLDNLKSTVIILLDFINYIQNDTNIVSLFKAFKIDNIFINEIILRISKIEEKLNLKLQELLEFSSFKDLSIKNQDLFNDKVFMILETLYSKLFSKLNQAFLNKIRINLDSIFNLLINNQFLDLKKNFDNILFIFNEVIKDLKNLKEDILFLENYNMKNINMKNVVGSFNYNIDFNKYLLYLDEFINYIENIIKQGDIKNKIDFESDEFIKKIEFILKDFNKFILDFDKNIDSLNNLVNLKINLKKINEILDKKINKLIDVNKNFNYSINSILSFSEIYDRFYSFDIEKSDSIKVFSFFKTINDNINNFKNNLLQEIEVIENSLNNKKEILISFSKDINNFIFNLSIIFVDLNDLKNTYENLDKIKQEYEILEELYNDFVSKSRVDVITFLSKKLFDLLYFNTNKVIEKLTEGRYNMFINQNMEIFIKDNWYSIDRGVRSLSGGEKFLTSLSLALAISEISSKSKYPIKSLFIDEGFSTLDVDTLNDVMEYLENYFNNISDKVLAIITHIPEVKEKFNYIIEVIKDKNGSKINIINKFIS